MKWTPQSGRNRLYSMMETRPDWVLSRQRAWGVPLTCFVKKGALPTDTDYLLRDEAVNARINEAFEEPRARTPGTSRGQRSGSLATIVDPDDWETRSIDILDVWFDSGSTHAFVLRDRPDGTEDGIADVYMEGTDQHRGWFHSSLAAIGRHDRPRALSQRGDPRFHAGREGQQDVQIARQHHRARRGGQAIRRGYPAALGGADRLYRRPADRARDPEGRRRLGIGGCAIRCGLSWAT